MFKIVALRFIRAFVSGAVSTMVAVLPLSATSWTEVGTWLNALALSGIIGGVTGVIMALDKLYRTK